jgi:hypothetical protein
VTHRSTAYVVAALMLTGVTSETLLRAQAPDFSGTWKFDAARSQGEAPLPLGSLRRANQPRAAVGRGATRPIDVDPTLRVIKQSGTEISIASNGEELFFQIDGMQRRVSRRFGGVQTQGKAEWQGNTLIVTTSLEVYLGQEKGYVTLEARDTYRLAGEVMTIDRVETTREGTMVTSKLTYTKSGGTQ